MTIRGVLFDKDGTLIDVNGTWVPIYRQMLCEQFDIKPAEANGMMERVGYNPDTEGFHANSILAAGTTRQLIEYWWPNLDEAGALEKVRMIDVDYAPLSKSLLKPLMPLAPLLRELKQMKLHVGLATNDSHYSACNHLNHLGVFELFDEVIAADTVQTPKPSGEMIRKFASTVGLSLLKSPWSVTMPTTWKKPATAGRVWQSRCSPAMPDMKILPIWLITHCTALPNCPPC